MELYEVRIHYAANNMVSEDARWIRVARQTASFKPVRRFKLSDTIVDESRLAAQSSGDCPQAYRPTQPISVSSESDLTSKSPGRVNGTNEESGQSTRKRKTNVSFEESSQSKKRRTKRTPHARARQGLNPKFKSPILGYLRSGKACQSFVDTPRDRIAPDTTIQVPVTKSPRRPPNTTDTVSAEGGLDQPDSQNQSTPRCIDETSFADHSGDLADASTAELSAERRASTDNGSFGIRSYPCNQEQLLPRSHHIRQSLADESGTSSYAFETGFEENEINVGTQMSRSVHKNSRSTPSGTTATPSESGEYANISSPLARKGERRHNSVNAMVDLTVSPNQNTLQPSRRDVLGPVSSPIIQQQQVSPRRDGAKGARNKGIFSLPRKAKCNAACTVKSRLLESFVPRYLLNLAEKFELLNQFRPVLAPTQMRNSDRGYWNLRIRVADMAEVAGARRPPLTSSQWSDQQFMMRQEGLLSACVSSEEANNALREHVYPNKNPKIYTPWTACELETFWAYLSKVIERGQAGYDVHATLKRGESTSEDLDIDVKLYGYAESLSHLWLLLYGVSGTLTASMPLQWFIPGDGPLLTMSGQLKHGGELGRWVPIGTGINASWGLEDNWDGLSSAINVGRTDKL